MRPTAYPLCWPDNRPRTTDRGRARFGHRHAGSSGLRELTLAEGRERVREELARLKAADVTISTDVPLRRDGLPRSDRKAPADPGAAVWFHVAGAARVLACDQWRTVGDNLAAIAKHIDALRGMERWGVGTIAEAFEGHRALPPWKWWEVLGVDEDADAATIRRAYRDLARTQHPDAGGDEDKFNELSAAHAAGLKARGR